MKTASRQGNIFAGALVWGLVGGLAVVPFLFLAFLSFARGWRFPSILPESWGGRAWAYAFDPTSGIASAAVVSVALALCVTPLAILVAVPAARALALHDFRGKRMVFFLLLLPLLSPALVTALSGHALFLRYGLADTWIGVVLAHLIPTVPYATLMLTGSFSKLDPDLEAQARSLGASRRQVWRYVTWPAIAPGVAVAASFAFLISWGQYLSTLFVGGGRIQSLPLLLVAFQRNSDEAVTSALTLIFLMPTILVFVVVARFLRD